MEEAASMKGQSFLCLYKRETLCFRVSYSAKYYGGKLWKRYYHMLSINCFSF